MKLSFWSDEDRLFVSRRIGFGWNINFKFIARRLGLDKAASRPTAEEEPKSETSAESKQDLFRKQIEASKYEEKRR